jgi:hypothetical protein
MALPASGAISLNQVNVELGNAGTTSINMNSAAVRGLFGVASGAISMSNGYGKSSQFAFSITANQTNANLRTLAVNAGWDQSTKAVATINSGVVMTSNTVGTPGLTINGAWPGGIELVNNGTIVGRGGNGGVGGVANANTVGSPGAAGTAGGLALTISVAASIRNNGTIAGGGGGGGGGGRTSLTNSSGAAGGVGPTSPGGPGSTGTFSAAGIGGYGGTNPNSRVYPYNTGGTGGNWGSNGVNGSRYFTSGGNGGSGGAAGPATSGQGNVTWLATGTRLGPLG